MTSSITPITAASDGGTTTKPSQRDHGLAVLRASEAKGLISLACDALSQTSQIGHAMHSGIYHDDREIPGASLRQQLEEALTCLQTADHYLRMLDEVIDTVSEPSGALPEEAPW